MIERVRPRVVHRHGKFARPASRQAGGSAGCRFGLWRAAGCGAPLAIHMRRRLQSRCGRRRVGWLSGAVEPRRIWSQGWHRERPAVDRCSSPGDASRAAGDVAGTVLRVPDALRGRGAAAVAGDVPGLRGRCRRRRGSHTRAAVPCTLRGSSSSALPPSVRSPIDDPQQIGPPFILEAVLKRPLARLALAILLAVTDEAADVSAGWRWRRGGRCRAPGGGRAIRHRILLW